MLKELIHEAVKNQDLKEYKGIHASALGGCPRTHYFNIKGVKQTTPPNLGALMNFKMGDVWEDTLFEMLKRIEGVEIHHHKGENWAIKDLNLVGTPDYSITFEGKNIIVDAKTVNSAWFNYADKSWKNSGLTKSEFLLKENHRYEIQLGVYLLMAKLMGKEYDHATLIFVNKDNSYIGWEVDVYLTKALELEIMDRIKYLNNCLEVGLVPQCECEGWKVGYCSYGRPSTRTQNTKKKWVNTECCPDKIETLTEWAKETLAEENENGTD